MAYVWLLLAAAAFNIGAGCWSMRLLWRYHRQLDQTRALNALLANLFRPQFSLRMAMTPSTRSPRRDDAASP